MESHGKSLKVALSEGNGFFLESDSDIGAFPQKNGMGHLKLKGILTTKSKSGLPSVVP